MKIKNLFSQAIALSSLGGRRSLTGGVEGTVAEWQAPPAFCKPVLLAHLHIALGQMEKKHCQRYKGPKALSTVTHSTPLIQSRSFTRFEILVKLQLRFVWQRVGKKRITLKNP